MKKTFKYIFVLAAAVLGLVSCDDELIPSKDNYSGYKGVKETFAYIVGATMPEYDAVSTEISHTPIGELGTISRTFEVALTKPQDTDVVLTIDVDNEAVTGSYSVFPEGVLKYDRQVTIPAGSLKDTVKVTVDNSDFAKLEELSYMAVFRISEASSVEISSNSNKALLYVATKTIDPSKNIITMTAATHKFNLSYYTNETTGDNISANFSVTGTDEAFAEFDIELVVDNSLIEAYNNENGTSYVAVPDGIVELANIKMAKDAKTARGSVSISDENRRRLSDENGYLVPVRISKVSPATLNENSGVVYLVINVAVFNMESNMFSALYLGDKNMACWYKFRNGIDMSGGFTYIFHVFVDNPTHQQRIGNIADANEGFINMLRIGERRNYEELEWWVGAGSNRKKLYAPLTGKKWHQVALVYDTRKYIFYVDGEVKSEYTLAENEKSSVITFQGIEFANSWGDSYRSSFEGRLAHFYVFDEALSSYYLDMYNFTPESWLFDYAQYYGLKAYWSMTEGKGGILHDRLGWEDIDFSNATRCNDEVSFVPFDATPYVQWVSDENNILQ